MIGQPQRSTLFPYTTLSRSLRATRTQLEPIFLLHDGDAVELPAREPDLAVEGDRLWRLEDDIGERFAEAQLLIADRSEEHTSELQSPCNLVCRLLLVKKTQTALGAHRARLPSAAWVRIPWDYRPAITNYCCSRSPVVCCGNKVGSPRRMIASASILFR